MTNKERQAKLQYLLNSLSMTKEQKDIVVDLVNSSGGGEGGAPTKDVITVKMNANDNNTLVVLRNDVEITSFKNEPIYDEQLNTTMYKSNEMFEFFADNFYNDFVMVMGTTYSTGDAQLVFNVMTKQIDATTVAFLFINPMGVVGLIGFQKEQ